MEAKRTLAKFGQLAAQSAQHSNRFFKAKHIRDYMMLETEAISSDKNLSSKKMKIIYDLYT